MVISFIMAYFALATFVVVVISKTEKNMERLTRICQRDNNHIGMKILSQGHPLVSMNARKLQAYVMFTSI